MTPPETSSVAMAPTMRNGVLQARMETLGKTFKALGNIAVEGIFRSKPKFTQKELDEAREACMRG